MRAIFTLSGLAVLASVLTGCTTPSLNPLATDATTVADQGVIGSWTEDHGDQTYVVTPTDDSKVYRLAAISHAADEQTIEAEVRIVKLGEDRFFDLSPTERQRDQVSKSAGSMFIPAHCIVKCKRDADTLTAWQLSSDWLKDNLKDGGQVLTHTMVDNDVVITAPTSELQAFIGRIASNEKAWGKPMVLQRLKVAEAGKAKAAEKK